MSTIERLGRGKHWLIGEYAIVGYRVLVNPDPLGEDGPPTEACYVTKRALFPVRQGPLLTHPRCPTGFDPDTGKRSVCVSPSSSIYADLCRYVRFRWQA